MADEPWHVSHQQWPCARCGTVVETYQLWPAWWLPADVQPDRATSWATGACACNRFCSACWRDLYHDEALWRRHEEETRWHEQEIRCSRCAAKKPAREFYRKLDSATGRMPHCIECERCLREERRSRKMKLLKVVGAAVLLLAIFAPVAAAQSPGVVQFSLSVAIPALPDTSNTLVVGAQGGSTLIIMPKFVSFSPSTDHGTVFSDGTAAVTRYEARAYAVIAPTVLVGTPKDLGKPGPVSGAITADVQTWVATLPGLKEYTVKIAAIGPTGEGVSAASNPFVPPGAPGAPGNAQVKQ